MTDESRVLAVLDASVLQNQTQVIRLAKMDTSRCIYALRRLADMGLVERFTAHAVGRGRPAFLYRRVQRAA